MKLDNILFYEEYEQFYLIKKFKNPQAAAHLLDEIAGIYDRMEDNPYQFPDSKDPYLLQRGYKEAYVPDMEYKLVFRIDFHFTVVTLLLLFRKAVQLPLF